jgi:hypothetical protein
MRRLATIVGLALGLTYLFGAGSTSLAEARAALHCKAGYVKEHGKCVKAKPKPVTRPKVVAAPKLAPLTPEQERELEWQRYREANAIQPTPPLPPGPSAVTPSPWPPPTPPVRAETAQVNLIWQPRCSRPKLEAPAAGLIDSAGEPPRPIEQYEVEHDCVATASQLRLSSGALTVYLLNDLMPNEDLRIILTDRGAPDFVGPFWPSLARETVLGVHDWRLVPVKDIEEGLVSLKAELPAGEYWANNGAWPIESWEAANGEVTVVLP